MIARSRCDRRGCEIWLERAIERKGARPVPADYDLEAASSSPIVVERELAGRVDPEVHAIAGLLLLHRRWVNGVV
ncbi:MAG: hypothetical protein R3B09_22455 [Nannocystaceae bacterium]